MQLSTETTKQIILVVLSAIGILALVLILAYTVYGTDATEEE
jgi:hypothetical protein